MPTAVEERVEGYVMQQSVRSKNHMFGGREQAGNGSNQLLIKRCQVGLCRW